MKPKINPQNTAVIIVDMQDYFLEPEGNFHSEEDVTRVIENQRRMVQMCAKRDIPLIFLEYRNRGSTISELLDLAEEAPRKARITKWRDSGFSSNDLSENLRKWSSRNIFLAGMNTSYCVRSTGADGVKLGLNAFSAEGVVYDSYEGGSYDVGERWLRDFAGMTFYKSYLEFPAFKEK